MGMIMGLSGALREFNEVREVRDVDLGHLALIINDQIGEQMPYEFCVSKAFEVDADGKPILPVRFEENEELRKKLRMFYLEECKKGGKLTGGALLAEETTVEFLYGKLGKMMKRNREEFWLKQDGNKEEAEQILVRVGANYHAEEGVEGFELIRENKIIGQEKVVTFLVFQRTARSE